MIEAIKVLAPMFTSKVFIYVLLVLSILNVCYSYQCISISNHINHLNNKYRLSSPSSSSRLYGKKSKGSGKSIKKELVTLQLDGEWDYWRLDELIPLLNEGSVGVIPTDTCYSFVAKLSQAGAVDRLLKLKGGSGHKKPLSLLCKDLSQVAKYTNQGMFMSYVYVIIIM